jgi:Fe-S cluster assembly iron-binding protein IscA
VITINDSVLLYCRNALFLSDSSGFATRISESRGCCFAYFSFDKTDHGVDGDILIEKDGLKFYLEPMIFEGYSEAALDYKDNMLTIRGQGRPEYSAPLETIRGDNHDAK